MRVVLAVLVASAVLAGCSQSSEPAPASPAEQDMSEFHYLRTGQVGDIFTAVRITAAEATSCTVSIFTTGDAPSDAPNAMMGAMHRGQVQMSSNGRSGWGYARAGETLLTIDGTAYSTNFGFPMPPLPLALSADEEALVWWAAMGVHSNEYAPIALADHLVCEGPIQIVQRYTSDHPVLWDDRAFTPAAPANLVMYASSDVSMPGGGDASLFSFDNLGSTQSTLRVQADGFDQTWDSSGPTRVTQAIEGLHGPLLVHLEELGASNAAGGPYPWIEGLWVDYEAVAELPGEHAELPSWSWSLPDDHEGDAVMLVEAHADADRSCTATVDAVGTRDRSHMSATLAAWGAGVPQMTWFREPAGLYALSVAGQSYNEWDSATYDIVGLSTPIHLPPGNTRIALALANPGGGTLTLACDGPAQARDLRVVAGRSVIYAGFEGTHVGTLAYDVTATQGTVDVAGPVTLLASGFTGTLNVAGEDRSFDIASGTALQAYQVVGPITFTATGTASSLTFGMVIADA